MNGKQPYWNCFCQPDAGCPELVGIKREDIDYVQKQILVHGKGEKDRYVYLNARALMAVNKYMKLRKDDNPYLFASSVDGFIYEKGKGKDIVGGNFPSMFTKNGILIGNLQAT